MFKNWTAEQLSDILIYSNAQIAKDFTIELVICLFVYVHVRPSIFIPLEKNQRYALLPGAFS